MATIHAYSSCLTIAWLIRLMPQPRQQCGDKQQTRLVHLPLHALIVHPRTVSVLARQLSEASVRADTRTAEAPADPPDSIIGDSYLTDKAQHDAEVRSTKIFQSSWPAPDRQPPSSTVPTATPSRAWDVIS